MPYYSARANAENSGCGVRELSYSCMELLVGTAGKLSATIAIMVSHIWKVYCTVLVTVPLASMYRYWHSRSQIRPIPGRPKYTVQYHEGCIYHLSHSRTLHSFERRYDTWLHRTGRGNGTAVPSTTGTANTRMVSHIRYGNGTRMCVWELWAVPMMCCVYNKTTWLQPFASCRYWAIFKKRAGVEKVALIFKPTALLEEKLYMVEDALRTKREAWFQSVILWRHLTSSEDWSLILIRCNPYIQQSFLVDCSKQKIIHLENAFPKDIICWPYSKWIRKQWKPDCFGQDVHENESVVGCFVWLVFQPTNH